MGEVLIYDCIRTPRGRAKADGALREMRPYRLLGSLLGALGRRHPGLEVKQISDVLIGCVSAVGDQGYNIAQAAVQDAGWPETIAAATVNRFCASGLETVHQAAARIAAGYDEAIVAGGVEVMSRVPLGAGGGALLEDPELILGQGIIPQGVAADLMATLFGFDREALDAYALQSQRRAAAAQAAQAGQAATAAATAATATAMIAIADANGILLLDRDEHLRPDTTLEALAALRPAFASETLARGGRMATAGFDALALSRYPQLSAVRHLHTAGTSSGLSDGAAVVLLGSAAFGEGQGLAARARVVAIGVASAEPTIMLTGMIPATEKVLRRAGLALTDMDVIEVNEAFAVVPLHFMRHFGLDAERVNVGGGAIALGHPVGATGAMLLGHLVDLLHEREGRYGLVTLCAAGGQGIACIVERVAK